MYPSTITQMNDGRCLVLYLTLTYYDMVNNSEVLLDDMTGYMNQKYGVFLGHNTKYTN